MGGINVTVALPTLVGSETLAALMTMFCIDATVLGAVYMPDVEIVPIDGFIDHVTAGFDALATEAENCCV